MTEPTSSVRRSARLIHQLSALTRSLWLTRALLMLLAGLCIVLLVIGFWGYSQLSQPISNLTDTQRVDLPRGAGAKTIAHRLHQAGVLDSPNAFVWYVRYHNQAHLLKAGEFDIEPHWTFADLMRHLVEGRNVQYPFQIVPGETWQQVRAKLQSLPKLRQQLTEARLTQLKQDFSIPASLEGYLLPETYFYRKDETDVMLIQRALEAMQNTLAAEWAQRSGGLPLKTPYEALILASIIEKETGAPHERHQVAGVFVRRLQKGMRLQTDPTVIYGMGEAYQGRIRSRDLREWTPYNTYRINGLPPTPIAMPSRESIHAALHPDNSDALYFVSKGNGEHYFSSSLEQHNRAVRRYILNRKD